MTPLILYITLQVLIWLVYIVHASLIRSGKVKGDEHALPSIYIPIAVFNPISLVILTVIGIVFCIRLLGQMLVSSIVDYLDKSKKKAAMMSLQEKMTKLELQHALQIIDEYDRTR